MELAPGQVAQMSKDAIKADPKFSKYARMVSVGVPLGAVRGKMTSDGLTDADVALFMTAYTTTGTLQGVWDTGGGEGVGRRAVGT